MIARLSIAVCLALVLVALGFTVRFPDPGPAIELSLFFDLQGEVDGVRFRWEDQRFDVPLLLTVEGADPGLIDGPYPGAVVPVSLTPVPPEAFFDSAALLAALRPGWTFEPIWGWGAGQIQVGATDVGVSEIFWVGSMGVGRGPEGERDGVFLFGFGADDPTGEFPEWARGTSALLVPFDLPAENATVQTRFQPRQVLREGPVEAPTRFGERIEVQLRFAE